MINNRSPWPNRYIKFADNPALFEALIRLLLPKMAEQPNLGRRSLIQL
jgi:hypothetical protein